MATGVALARPCASSRPPLALLAVAFVVPTRHLTAVGPAASFLGVTSHSPEPASGDGSGVLRRLSGARASDAWTTGRTSRPPAATRHASPRPVDDPRRKLGRAVGSAPAAARPTRLAAAHAEARARRTSADGIQTTRTGGASDGASTARVRAAPQATSAITRHGKTKMTNTKAMGIASMLLSIAAAGSSLAGKAGAPGSDPDGGGRAERARMHPRPARTRSDRAHGRTGRELGVGGCPPPLGRPAPPLPFRQPGGGGSGRRPLNCSAGSTRRRAGPADEVR